MLLNYKKNVDEKITVEELELLLRQRRRWVELSITIQQDIDTC